MGEGVSTIMRGHFFLGLIKGGEVTVLKIHCDPPTRIRGLEILIPPTELVPGKVRGQSEIYDKAYA